MARTMSVTSLAGILLVVALARGTTGEVKDSKGKPKERTAVFIEVLHAAKPSVRKVMVKGEKWRLEERVDDSLVSINLFFEGWEYLLFPAAKTGIKSKRKQPPRRFVDPTTLLAELKKQGVKKVGDEKLSGEECEVCELRPAKEIRWKVWARKKDGVVVKMESETAGRLLVREFKEIQVGVPIDDALFVVPGDYRLKEEQQPPSSR